MQMSGTHNYYGSVCRAAHGGGRNSHTHDLSSKYYYEHPQKQPVVNGSGSNNNNNFCHHSISDNNRKEGEEWETAS
ncbi:unnamed protein product [Adineta steineri]|uniref:Uncharacterized protein n=2 Tax=Adineta steineri TaxID=433720 RepID=A0A814U9W0_9BILA|nr:unnamed protein product [Adineta steineri]CAF3523792.1 unnamed protein product [Adineta steineri]